MGIVPSSAPSPCLNRMRNTTSLFPVECGAKNRLPDELRERTIFFAELSDAVLKMVNGADGKSDIEGKARWVVVSELGSERVSNGREHMSQLGNERVSMRWNLRKTSQVPSTTRPRFRSSRGITSPCCNSATLR